MPAFAATASNPCAGERVKGNDILMLVNQLQEFLCVKQMILELQISFCSKFNMLAH